MIRKWHQVCVIVAFRSNQSACSSAYIYIYIQYIYIYVYYISYAYIYIYIYTYTSINSFYSKDAPKTRLRCTSCVHSSAGWRGAILSHAPQGPKEDPKASVGHWQPLITSECPKWCVPPIFWDKPICRL